MIRALALTGPTASGKTALSLSIAKTLGCEIIGCDSMQIYKRMDIGTAKATAEERAQAPHHLIDFLSPTEKYSAEDYRSDALATARDIVGRGRHPLFVGGTGLYIDSLMRGAPISPPSDATLRDRLMSEAEADAEAVWHMLAEVDPESAEKIHKNNIRRVVRALEIYQLSGRTKSYFDELSRSSSPDISVSMITLDFHNRENLYARVDARVELMMKMGLEKEVRGLYEDGLLDPSGTAAQAIGYKEMLAYFRGDMTRECAIEEIKLASRRYAKRQLTWFRHESDAYRLYVDREDGRMKDAGLLTNEAVQLASSAIK